MKAQDSNPLTPPNAPFKHVLFEPLALLLLSLAMVGTAWCSFQADAWRGVSQRAMNLSAVAGRRAAANELENGRLPNLVGFRPGRQTQGASAKAEEDEMVVASRATSG